MKKIISLMMSVLIILNFSGCWDRIEIEELAYIVAIGIDKGKKEGSISVTLQIENPQVGATEKASAENEPANMILTFEAPDVLSAQDIAVSNIARRLNYSHVEALVLGEEFARSEECLNIVTELLRNREIRSLTNLMVCRESASEFIRANQPPIETRVHKFYVLISGRWAETGFSPISNIHRYLQRTEQDEGLGLAIYCSSKKSKEDTYGNVDEYLPGQIKIEGGNPIQFIGSAVFKEGKMIGAMTGEETRISAIIRKDYPVRGMKLTFPDPLKSEYRITTNIYEKGRAKTSIDVSGETPVIDVSVELEAGVLYIPSHVGYAQDMDKQELLRTTIKKALEEKTREFIKKTQKEFEADPFLWGIESRKQFSVYDEYKNYDWMKRYPSARVNVHYDIELRSFGKELDPVPVERVRD